MRGVRDDHTCLCRRSLALALVTGNAALLAEGAERLELLLLLGDLAWCFVSECGGKGDRRASGGGGEIIALAK
jgi:hypothetical protein